MSEKVKPGYKQTEVGVIPEDWNVHTLRSCLSAQPDYGINAPAVPFSDKLPAYIRITDITEDGRFSSDNPVSVQRADADRYYLNDGNIVFARTGASVGKSYLYKPKDGKLVFAGFLIRVSPDAEKLVPAYLSGYVTTGGYWSWVRLMSMRSGQPGINGKEYGQLPIPLPPTINEQRAIAGALSDVDALIGALDSALSKKRDLKQAAMQQLLTGQKRLPGFHGEWAVKRLGYESALITKGTTPTSLGKDFKESGVNFIKVESMTPNGEFIKDKFGFIDGETHNLLKRSQLQDGDLLISIAGALGRTGIVNKDILPANTNQAFSIVRLKNNSGINIQFIYYLLRMEKTKKHIEGISVQGAQANLSLQNIADLAIECPSLPEQTAIAEVLSDMDAELAALTQRRDKTRALKQGMMQELLTGRTRLV
jgi:type I restriction enzyme S subunit